MSKKVHYMDANTGEYGSFDVDENTHPLDAATAEENTTE